MTCDHAVAHGYEDDWGGFILASVIGSAIVDVVEILHGYILSNPQVAYWQHLKAQPLKGWLDRELTTFDYCPFCGEKIDWEEIIRNTANE